jgi:hypothetical protein
MTWVIKVRSTRAVYRKLDSMKIRMTVESLERLRRPEWLRAATWYLELSLSIRQIFHTISPKIGIRYCPLLLRSALTSSKKVSNESEDYGGSKKRGEFGIVEECISVKRCHNVDGRTGADGIGNPHKYRKYDDKPFIREYDKTPIDLMGNQREC